MQVILVRTYLVFMIAIHVCAMVVIGIFHFSRSMIAEVATTVIEVLLLIFYITVTTIRTIKCIINDICCGCGVIIGYLQPSSFWL